MFARQKESVMNSLKKNVLKNFFRISAILILAVCLFASCVPGGDQGGDEPAKPEYKLILTNGEYKLKTGGSTKIDLLFTANGEGADRSLLTFETSNKKIATVDKDGNVKAFYPGNATVTVKYEDQSKGVDIIVEPVEATSEQVNTFSEEYINIFGRNYMKNGELRLDQTANAVEFGMLGGTLTVQIKSNAMSYMQVYIDDDTEGTRVRVYSGKRKYVLAEDLPDGYHTVRFVKSTEMMDAQWSLLSVEGDKLACAPAKPDFRVEFVGDSITAGYGVLGVNTGPRTIDNSDASQTYAYKTVQKMNIDYSTIAWSGICTKALHWIKATNMDTLYKRISHYNKEDYAFDFDPDVVIVNLGGNDSSYMSPEYGGPEYAEQFPEDYLNFLKYVREKNPNAHIICIYGMMGIDERVENGIKSAIKAMNDQNIVYDPFEIVPNYDAGASHPDVEAYEGWAVQLSEYLSKIREERGK